MSNLFKPYEKTTGWITANPPPDQEEESKKPKSTPAKSEDKSSTKTTKQESKPKAASNESKSPSATDTQPQKSKPFPTATEQDGFMHPQSGFSLDPKKEPEPIKAPEKSKGLMIQPQPPQKTILGMKYDPPKPVQPTVVKSPEEAGGRNWFLEGLLGDDYTTKFNKHPTPDDPFLQGLYGVEEPKHHTDEASTPQQFVSKTQPIDKFMGVTPSAPFDRPLDNPQYNQPPLPPKPQGGTPKDYVHNPEGKKTYDFRDPQLSALDYVFGTDFKPVEWKQGIDSGGKLGYDGNRDVVSNENRLREQTAILSKTGMALPDGYTDIDSVFDDYYKALQMQNKYDGWGVFKKPFTKEDNEAAKTVEKLKPFVNGLSIRTMNGFPVQKDNLSSEFGQLTSLGVFEYANVPITIAQTPAGTKGYIVHDSFYPEKAFEKLMNDDYTRLYMLGGSKSMGKLVSAEAFANQESFRNFAADMQNLITQEARAYASMDRIGGVIGSGKKGAGKEDGFGAKVQGVGGKTTLSNWTGKTGDLAKTSPIEIPENSTVKMRTKAAGYDQISYKWSEHGYTYEARWHTKTPGAPAGQGNTWVVERVTHGTPTGQQKVTHIKVGETWVTRRDWQRAIEAYQNGTMTAAQEAVLKEGHWIAP